MTTDLVVSKFGPIRPCQECIHKACAAARVVNDEVRDGTVEEVAQSLYGLLARIRKEAKDGEQFANDDWDTGHAAGLEAASVMIARYIEEHGGKGTTKEVS